MKYITVDKDNKSRKMVEKIVDKLGQFELVKSCSSPSDALDVVMRRDADLVFLGADEFDSSSLSFLDLPIGEYRPQIILLSNKKELAKEAFDYDATDFILKPFTAERLMRAVMKASKRKSITESRNSAVKKSAIFLKLGKQLLNVSMKDIYLVEALADYVNIYIPEKRFTIHSTMKNVEDKLAKKDFARVHKSYIVRIESISEIQGNHLMVGKHKIPIGPLYKKELMKRVKII